MKRFLGLLLVLSVFCCINLSVIAQQQSYFVHSYDLDGKRQEFHEVRVENFVNKDDDGQLMIEQIKNSKIEVPDYVLHDASEEECFVILNITTDNEENPYANIERMTIEVRKKMASNSSGRFGKDYRVFYVDNEPQGCTNLTDQITDSRETGVSFSVEKLGTYIIYYNPAIYSVKFYQDMPEYDEDGNIINSESLHKEIVNLKRSDIIDFPDIPQKEGFVFSGWKAMPFISGGGIIKIPFANPQPLTANSYFEYYATWCPEAEYEPIEIQISSEENITKGKENGKKITLKTNYGIFARDEDFPAEWRSEYDAETDAETKEAMLSDWKTKWNIVGNDDIMVESAERIDDKTVELTLSGNSDDIYHASDLQVEFASYLLLPEPYEENGEWIEWDDTKIKMDSDGVRLAMYPSDNTLKVSAQRRPGGGSLRIPEEKESQKEEPKEEEQPTTEEAPQTEEKDETILFTVGEKKATVFGEERINDVAPLIRGDRAFLPARFVAESQGAVVTWEEENQTVIITKDDIKIVITIGAQTAMVNGEEFELDTPAFIEQDRTYTPIRFIAEKLGGSVDWKPDSQTIIITK